MIDEKATFEKYGYYSTDLKPQSHKKIVAVCDGCGAVRYPNKQNYSILCSKCANINSPSGKDHYRWVDKPPNICEWCGKEYSVPPSKASGSRFCSRECYVNMVLDAGENNPNWRGGKVVCICEVCGKDFLAQPSVNRKYCSRECASVAKIGKRRENGPDWKDGKKSHICEWCGEEFFASPADHRRFCSWKCSGKYKSKYVVGELAGNWKGGLSFLPYCPKFDDDFKEGIREKYGRVCFVCGKTESRNGQRLSVHHTNYLKECLCVDIKCEFVPLCVQCHTRTNGNRLFWELLFMYSIGYYEEYYNVEIPKGLLRLNI